MEKLKLNFKACFKCNEPMKVGKVYHEVLIGEKRYFCCESCLKILQEQQTMNLFANEKETGKCHTRNMYEKMEERGGKEDERKKV